MIFNKDFNVKEMLTNSDIADNAGKLINRYLMDYPEVKNYDDKWKLFFKELSTTKESELFPKNGDLAVVYKAMGPGQEPEFATFTGKDDVTVRVIKYRGAVRFDNDVIKYNQLAKLEWFLNQMREKGAQKIAEIHYACLTAAAVNGNATGGTTALALGNSIDAEVVTMVNLGFEPQKILCNIADESLVKAAIEQRLRIANMERDLTIKPLSAKTYALEVVSTRMVAAGKIFIAEPEHYAIALKDSIEGELGLDNEMDKLHDAQNLYGKFYKGCAVLSDNTIRYITIA